MWSWPVEPNPELLSLTEANSNSWVILCSVWLGPGCPQSSAEPNSRDFKYWQVALFLCPKCLGFLVYIGSEVISDFPKILGIGTRSYTLSTEQAKFTSAPGLPAQLTFPLFTLVDYVILFYSNQIIPLRSFLPVPDFCQIFTPLSNHPNPSSTYTTYHYILNLQEQLAILNGSQPYLPCQV